MGKPFILFKFRTMRDLYKPDDQILPDAERLTKLGKILRSFSLDELPTLLNVLKGDMSIVGPRPLLMQYLARYSPEQARRHDVKPGITGWAQINGRNSISWEKKFNLDVWYIKNYSLILDMKILILTIWKSIKREGINQPGEATSREFMGSIH
jgi:sugar transferase EpsL